MRTWNFDLKLNLFNQDIKKCPNEQSWKKVLDGTITFAWGTLLFFSKQKAIISVTFETKKKREKKRKKLLL